MKEGKKLNYRKIFFCRFIPILLFLFIIFYNLFLSCKELEPSKQTFTLYTNFTDYEKRVGDSCYLITYGDDEDELEEECEFGNKDEVKDAVKLGKALFEV